jgi:glycosyltransferase involved in cell wall biosynthesis
MSPWGIVEANAACIPTISTNLGGIPELIHSDEGRLLMNEATTDAIAERIDYVIGEKSRLPDLKAKAYEKYMAHQNIDRNAKRLQSLLLGAIDSSPRLNAFQAQAAG